MHICEDLWITLTPHLAITTLSSSVSESNCQLQHSVGQLQHGANVNYNSVMSESNCQLQRCFGQLQHCAIVNYNIVMS